MSVLDPPCCTVLAFPPAGSKSSACLHSRLSPFVSFTTLPPTQPPPTPGGGVYFPCSTMLQTPEMLLGPETQRGNSCPFVHLNIRRHRYGAMDSQWYAGSLVFSSLPATQELGS